MSRPRRSTRDEWLDTFFDWDVLAQETALEVAALIRYGEHNTTSFRGKP